MVVKVTIIYIGNGCEGCSTYIYIHSKSDLIGEIDTCIRHKFFDGFNIICQNMTRYSIWYELKLETLANKQKDRLGIKLSEFPPVALNHLSERIHQIGMDLPWHMPSNAVLAGLVACASLGCAVLIFSLWHIEKLHMLKW